MSYEPPSPPANLPTEVVDTLNEAPPELLREVTRYTEALAEYKEREARLEEETDNTNVEERPDDLPDDDVPTKATITIKEINDNRYYYWQWREGSYQVKIQRAGQSRQVSRLHRSRLLPAISIIILLFRQTLHHCQ